jgi:hypothetical protein
MKAEVTKTAPLPHRMSPVNAGAPVWVRRSCSCGPTTGHSACADCTRKKGREVQRWSLGEPEATSVPERVRQAVTGVGTPLDGATRTEMENYFAHDFSSVRVHTGTVAAESAAAISARAYTVGSSIVFGTDQYAPHTAGGKQLLAHELTHVIQQGGAWNRSGPLHLGDPHDVAETEADTLARGIGEAATGSRATPSQLGPGAVQRQLVTPLGPGGGFGGLMDRDRMRSGGPGSPAVAAAAPFQVCSRDLQGALGLFANHAYVDAPPFRYAIISPLCGQGLDNPLTGTTAQKWDNSPDPCGKTPNCVPCTPAPGVTDVAKCLRSAFRSYASLSLYKGLGPNSNTFAGTLARSCCAGMVPKPAALGNCPGWDDPAAPARAGASPCPPGPTC